MIYFIVPLRGIRVNGKCSGSVKKYAKNLSTLFSERPASLLITPVLDPHVHNVKNQRADHNTAQMCKNIDALLHQRFAP